MEREKEAEREREKQREIVEKGNGLRARGLRGVGVGGGEERRRY